MSDKNSVVVVEYPIGLLAHNLLQAKEIKEHSYFLLINLNSLGYEMGQIAFENFATHWRDYGYAEHFRDRVIANAESISKECQKTCGGKCPPEAKSTRECLLDINKIHELLQDGPGGNREERRVLFSKDGELELLLKK